MIATKIIAVEDERIVALHLKQQLIKLGYEVPAVASSGAQALRDIAEFHPDLVLMDIHIDGDIDGIEAASRIPGELRIPVIYLTAYSEEATLERARATKPYGYLIKPYSERELHATIQMALAHREDDEAEQRERLIDELTASNLERGRFVHAASHDLREPARMASTFSARLAEAYADGLDQRGKDYLSHVIDATDHLNLLLDDLGSFARAGDDTEPSCWFSPEQTLNQIILMFDDAARSSGARIESTSLLPQVYGNRTRFHRLMQNLIGNALKYVPAGVSPLVQISAEQTDQLWTFSVKDNGIGIGPRHFERIFEPFKRLHSSSSYPGTGLGLAICRKIVESFEGQISVRSAEGEGSTFFFTIPSRNCEGLRAEEPSASGTQVRPAGLPDPA